MLGEADLVDPSLGGRFDIALDGLDRVVDRLVRRAEMHVVVDDQSQDATSSRSAGVVTFSRRGIALDGTDAAAVRFHERGAIGRLSNTVLQSRKGVSEDSGDEGLGGLRSDEALAVDRLRDGIAVDALDRVRDRERRDCPVPALVERSDHPLDHFVRDERPRRIVHEDDRRLFGHLGESCADGLAARLTTCHRLGDLAGRDLLGDQDARLLPLGWRRDDDPLDPVGAVEPLERLCDERPVVQGRERLRAVQPETLTTARRRQDRPDAHGGRGY